MYNPNLSKSGYEIQIYQNDGKTVRVKKVGKRGQVSNLSKNVKIRRAGEGAGGAGGDVEAFRCQGRRAGEAQRGGGGLIAQLNSFSF